MTKETENLILEHLKKSQARLTNIEVDIGDMKLRLSGLEQVQGQLLASIGAMNQRMDRFDERLAPIERRLDLIEA